MFDIHQNVCDKHGEVDGNRVGNYIDGLMAAFAKSPEAQPLLEHAGDVNWAGTFLELFFEHIDSDFPCISLSDFNEIVCELFPRKVSTPAEDAGPIIAELATFFAFLGRQYGLKAADKSLASLTEQSATRLEKEMADPANYGMAKGLVMGGLAAGYDMTTQEGMDAYMREQQPVFLDDDLSFPDEGTEEDEDWDDEPPLSLPAPLTPEQRAQKRKERKRQRQARKRRRK